MQLPYQLRIQKQHKRFFAYIVHVDKFGTQSIVRGTQRRHKTIEHAHQYYQRFLRNRYNQELQARQKLQ